MTTALARVRKLWPSRWRGLKRHELAIAAGVVGILAGLPHWGVYSVVAVVWIAHRLREVRVGTIEDFDVAIARLHRQIACERAHRRRGLLVRAYRLAERVHERRFGAHDWRSIACKVLSAQAQLHTRFDEQHGVDVAALVDALGRAQDEVLRYGLRLLLQFETLEHLRLDGSHFARLWEALAGNVDGRVMAARMYADQLAEHGEIDDARAVLLLAADELTPPPASEGSPFRALVGGNATEERAIAIAIAEGWDSRGEFERAWDMVAELRHDANDDELRKLSGIAFNAGHVLWACRTTRRLAYSAAGELRATLLFTLVWRLVDLDALAAARAFLAEATQVSGEALTKYRELTAACLGDGNARALWIPASPWRVLEHEAELALRRGEGTVAVLHAEAAWTNAVEQHGEDHPYVSDALQVLGRALLLAGRRDDGVRRLGEGLDLVERRCGPEHPQVLRLLRPLAEANPDFSGLRERIEHLRRLHRLDEIDAMRPPSP